MKNLIVIFLTAIIVSCTGTPDTGVTTFPNSMKGKVTSENEVSVTLAKISVSKNDIIAKQYTTETKDGKFEFNDIEPGKYVAVYSDENGDLAINSDIEMKDNEVVELETKDKFNSYYLRGVVKNSSTAIVTIPGVSSTKVTNDGVYIIKAPSGNLPIFIQDNENLVLDLRVAENEQDTIGILDISFEDSHKESTNKYLSNNGLYEVTPLIYDVGEEPDYYDNYSMGLINYANTAVNTNYGNNIYLDNFEHDNFPQSALGKITDSWWYQTNDSSSTNQFTREEEEDGNHFLSVKTYLNTNYAGPYASTGVSLGEAIEYDLSTADSLEFKIRGKGTVQLTVETKQANESENVEHHKFDITLNGDWNNYRFDFKDFQHTTLEWDDVSSKIYSIEFTFAEFVGSDTDTDLYFDLDDLTIKGTTVSDIIKE